jgi:type I restriction-modification system DNA methylase subunit
MKPEEQARQDIDKKLEKANWLIQDRQDINLGAGPGIAVREFPRAGETIRRKLLHECDVNTHLRLPTGVFYAQGVKANVLFFDRKPASETPWSKELWIYDLRTNKHFTLKTNPLKYEDLQDFIKSYNPGSRHQREETERFKCFTYDEEPA